MADRRRALLHPGPMDRSILYSQDEHISQAVWQGTKTDRVLMVRVMSHIEEPHPRMVPLLMASGFHGVACMRHITIDHGLISAFVERWRPETHTFHMPQGEMTITLQDIEVQLGLPVDGAAVTGVTRMDWRALCRQLLGDEPPHGARWLRGQCLSMGWLATRFAELPDDADVVTVEQYTRAYILRLLGALLCSDKSTQYVHLMFLPLIEDLQIAGTYSWGSAVLAWTYRELCRASRADVAEISGCMLLLQVWAWDRFPTIAPTRRGRLPVMENPVVPLAYRWCDMHDTTGAASHVLSAIRFSLDHLKPNEVVWEPYRSDLLQELPAYCTAGHAIWSAEVPLICFHIVEWHSGDRVMRQFGLQQPIPHDSDVNEDLHGYTLQGKDSWNWEVYHGQWIELWNHRRGRCPTGDPACEPIHHNSEYMRWYRRITRRWISPTGAVEDAVADLGIELQQLGIGPGDPSSLLARARRIGSDLVEIAGEHHRLEALRAGSMAPPSGVDRPFIHVEPIAAHRDRARRRRRDRAAHEARPSTSMPTQTQYEATPSIVAEGTSFSHHSQHGQPSSSYIPPSPPASPHGAGYDYASGPSSSACQQPDFSSLMDDPFSGFLETPSPPPPPFVSSTLPSFASYTPQMSGFGVPSSPQFSGFGVPAWPHLSGFGSYSMAPSTVHDVPVMMSTQLQAEQRQPTRVQPSRRAHGAGVRCGTGGCVIGGGRQPRRRRRHRVDEEEDEPADTDN